MRANGKNVTLKEFGKPCSTKVGTLSKKISKLNIKNGMKISPKRYKPKLKSHKKVVSCVGKRIRNGSSDRKLVSNRTSKSYKKQKKHFSSHQSETLPNSCRDLEKQDNVDVKSQKLKKRKKWRRQRDNAELDEASRLQRRTRYLLVRMKLEQNLIDAYSGEGWKGQSREKIKPEKELQRAKKQILKCKLGIRDVIRQLDLLSSVGCIENSVIAPDGSVHHEHIICANCKLQEAFPDNDIILCDGTCNCAFHQKCLDPPLLTENIPPGDQGWFCKFCESKMEIIETTNAHLGTHFSADSHWQDIFREEAALPDGQGALEEEEWPSDDSEDDDYDPDKIENSHSYIRVGSETDGSVDLSSSTSLWSLEDEVLSESKSLSNRSKGGLNAYFGSNVCVNSNETSDCEILSGPRQRRAVDYKKLYDEMFGKDAPVSEQISEDEDWGPSKRKRREKESDAASTLMTLSVSKKKFTNVYIMEGKENGGMSKRQFFRIPHDAVEKLRIAFAENELPSRPARENLSKELGLDFEKVNKWFKNARYMALKARKVEKTNHFDYVSPKINKKSGSEISKDNAADPTASNDFSSAPKDHQSNHPKKGHRRKHPLSGNKADEEIDADVSLKILLALAKKTKKKSLTSKAEGKILEPEAELERLFKMKDKIEKLQHVLQRFRNRKSGKTDKSIIDGHSESVVYVPVAELVEKQ